MIRQVQCLAYLASLVSVAFSQEEDPFKVTISRYADKPSTDHFKNKATAEIEGYFNVTGHVGGFVDIDPAKGFTVTDRIEKAGALSLKAYTENVAVRFDMDETLAFVQTNKESVFIDTSLSAEEGLIRFDGLAPVSFNAFGYGKGYGALGAVSTKEGGEKVTEIHLIAKLEGKWKAISYYSSVSDYISMKFRYVLSTEKTHIVLCFGRTVSGAAEYRVLELTNTEAKLIEEGTFSAAQKTDRYEVVVVQETKEKIVKRYALAITHQEDIKNATSIFTIYSFGDDNKLTKVSSIDRYIVQEDDTGFSRLSCLTATTNSTRLQCVYTDNEQVTRTVVLAVDTTLFEKNEFIKEIERHKLDTLKSQGMRPLCSNPAVKPEDYCFDASSVGNFTVLRMENSNYDPAKSGSGILGEKYQAFVYNTSNNLTVYKSIGIKDLEIEPTQELQYGLDLFVYTANSTENQTKIAGLRVLGKDSEMWTFNTNSLAISAHKQQDLNVHQKLGVRQLDGKVVSFVLDEYLEIGKSIPPVFDSKLIVYAGIGFIILLAVMGVMYLFLNKIMGDLVTHNPETEEKDGDLSEKLTTGPSIATDSNKTAGSLRR